MGTTIDPEAPAEEPTEEPGNEAVTGVQTDAVVSTESEITIKYADADKKEEDKTTTGGATIVFLHGCVNDGKLAKDRDLEFRVEPDSGRKLAATNPVMISIDGKTAESVPKDANDVYKVSNSKFSTGSGENISYLSGEITVTTQAVTGHNIVFKDGSSEADSYEIYSVTTVEEEGKDPVTTIKKITVGTDKIPVKLGEDQKFALVIKDGNKLDTLTMDGKAITPIEDEDLKLQDSDEKATPCKTFVLKPSDTDTYPGLASNEDEKEAAVTIKVVAKAALTVTVEADTHTEIGAPEDKDKGTNDIPYDETKEFGEVNLLEGDEALETKSLLFTAKLQDGEADKGYKFTGVSVKATEDDSDPEKEVAELTAEEVGTNTGLYRISLEPLADTLTKDTTLTIKAESDYDTDKKDKIRTIDFVGTGDARKHVTIKHGKTSKALDKTLKENENSVVTDADTYYIEVTPETGYELTKGTKEEGGADNSGKYVVTVEEKRTYTNLGTNSDQKKEDVEVKTEMEAVDSDGAAIELALKLNDAVGDTGYGEDTISKGNKPYYVTEMSVTIATQVEENTQGKNVQFVNSLKAKGATYQVTNDTTKVFLDQEEAEEGKDIYWISKGVPTLDFTVTSTVAPKVTCAGYEDENSKLVPIKAVSATENVYTYSIPAAKITADGKITIDADDLAKTIAVTVKPDEVALTYTVGDRAPEAVDFSKLTPEKEVYTLTQTPSVGDEINLTFKAKQGASISKITYTMEDAAEPSGEITADENGKFSKDLVVTGKIAVTVESTKANYVVLADKDGNPLNNENGIYTVDYNNAKNIKILLKDLENDANVPFYNVVVKEGTNTAATVAKLATGKNTEAEIAEVDSSEYGSVLTIEVYQKGVTTPSTAKLQTTKASAAVEITYLNDKNKTEKVVDSTEIALKVDSKMNFTVKSVDGTAKDLAVKVLTADNKADAATVTTSGLDEGEFTLTAVSSKEVSADKVNVIVYNVNDAKDKDGNWKALAGGSFTVKLTDHLVKSEAIKEIKADKGSSNNREVRVNLDMVFADKKNVPAKPVSGNLYYKVEPSAPTGAPTGVEVFSAEELVQYIPVKVDAEGKYSAPATTALINLVKKNPDDKKDATTGKVTLADIDAEISTTVKVTLVQSVNKKLDEEKTVAEADYVARSGEKTVDLNTLKPVYETKLTVKTIGGAAVLTGQNDVKVAAPSFSKETSYDSIRVQFVNTKTGVLYGEEGTDGKNPAVADWDGDNEDYNFTAWADSKDNSIHVGISEAVLVNSSSYWSESNDQYKSILKNLGVKVIADAPDNGYRAAAVVKLKIQQGIFDVDVDESKATVPESLYKAPKKKATVKITPALNVVNGDGKTYKPAKSKVTWSIIPASGNTSEYAKNAVYAAKPLVSIKNGTVTVDSKYEVKGTATDNTFTVIIRADDFAGNGYINYNDDIDITITSSKAVISKNLVLLDSTNKPVDAASLGAENFTDNTVFVAALKDGAKLKNGAYEPEYFEPVTYKSNAKAVVDVTKVSYSNKGILSFKKPGKVTITATTVDGSKVSAKLQFEVKPYKQLALSIEDIRDVENGLQEYDGGIKYSGGSNEVYSLSAYYVYGEKMDRYASLDDYKNLKITVKGGKFLSNKYWKTGSNYMGEAVVVTDKKGTATITLTDTANKDKKSNSVSYTITNESAVQSKAPSIKMSFPKKLDASAEKITWKVTEKDKTKKNYAGSYVMLAPDNTAPDKNGAFRLLGSHGTILKIDENGEFTLKNPDLTSEYPTYKMVATIGTMDNGNFKAAVKDVKLNLKLSVKKVNTKLSMTTSYTLDQNSAAVAELKVKTGTSYTVSDTKNVILKGKDQKKDLHANNFNYYFTVNDESYENEDGRWVDYYTIGLRNTLTEAEIQKITSPEGKADCQGYVTVTNHNRYYDDYEGDWVNGDEYNTKDFLVKISFKGAKYSLTGATIFANEANKEVTANVKLMSGKTTVNAAHVKVKDAAGFAKKAEVEKDGSITITGAAAAGKYPVVLQIVPGNSGYITKDKSDKWVGVAVGGESKDTLTLDQVAEKHGVELTASIDLKDLATAKLAKVKNTKLTLTPDSYETAIKTGNMGNYVVYADYDIAIGGTDIAKNDKDTAKSGVSVDMMKGDVNNNEVVKSEKEKLTLVTVEKGTNPATEKPAIKLCVSKEALLLLTEQAKTQKVITSYGKNKKLTVPVTVKYDNGVSAVDTINFTLTMPKEAPKDLAGVKALLAGSSVKDILTKKLLTTNGILDTLREEVRDAAEAVVPKDSDVVIAEKSIFSPKDSKKKPAEQPTDESVIYANIMEEGSAVITLGLTDRSKTKDNTDEVAFTYNMDIKSSVIDGESNDLLTIAQAIESDKDANEPVIKYTNNTTKGTLLDDIKKITSVKKLIGTGKGNISLKVTSFTKIPATENMTGSITAEIMIRDLARDGYWSSQTVTLENRPIAKLVKLSKAQQDINDEIKSSNMADIIEKCGGQEAVIKAYVLAKAEELANNGDIKVTFAKDAAGKELWDFKEPTHADASVTPAVVAEDGTVTFTLQLTKGNKSVECTPVEGTIPETAKYADKTKAETEVKAAVAEDRIKASLTNDKEVNITVIETKLNALAKDGSDESASAGFLPGWVWEWKKGEDKEPVFTQTDAKSETDGSITGTVILYLEGAKGTTQESSYSTEITITSAIPQKPEYQTYDELKRAIEAFSKITIASGSNLPENENAALTLAKDKVAELKKTGALTDVTITVDASSDTGKVTAYAMNDDKNAVISMQWLKVTLKAKDAEAETLYIENIVFEVASGS